MERLKAFGELSSGSVRSWALNAALTLQHHDWECFASTDKEPALQAAALSDGCPTECGTRHSDCGGHPSRD